ncbi:MAG TPA: zinc-dependent alcohol dehydrogenase [Tepidisphaeraceae bacterium]|jgi:threonine dehydrogenase-like Zn-dependent dehydrogenase
MKALCWNAKNDVRVETVPDPKILNPRDAIIKITTTAICGSDLHLLDGYIPTMKPGDILGHEFMGEVVELGSEVRNLQKGDRVVVPFNIACGNCWYCKKKLWSCCDNSNPSPDVAEGLYGAPPSALFGYSHMFGGYAGGQAQYVRVPFADVGPMKVPDGVPDEKVIFLTDIFPTGYMAVENCNVQQGDTIAIWGCGPVGQFAIKSAFLLGAEQVIAMDDVPERLKMARQSGATTIDISKEPVYDRLMDLTAGRGPDGCVDCVGLEAHGATLDHWYDMAKVKLGIGTDRTHALRQTINCVRKGGTVSIPGVYGGFLDKFPFGAAFAKGVTFKMGQTHTHTYLKPLLDRVQNGEIDPSFVITHTLPLEQAPHGYEIFRAKKDECVKVVLKPN